MDVPFDELTHTEMIVFFPNTMEKKIAGMNSIEGQKMEKCIDQCLQARKTSEFIGFNEQNAEFHLQRMCYCLCFVNNHLAKLLSNIKGKFFTCETHIREREQLILSLFLERIYHSYCFVFLFKRVSLKHLAYNSSCTKSPLVYSFYSLMLDFCKIIKNCFYKNVFNDIEFNGNDRTYTANNDSSKNEILFGKLSYVGKMFSAIFDDLCLFPDEICVNNDEKNTDVLVLVNRFMYFITSCKKTESNRCGLHFISALNLQTIMDWISSFELSKYSLRHCLYDKVTSYDFDPIFKRLGKSTQSFYSNLVRLRRVISALYVETYNKNKTGVFYDLKMSVETSRQTRTKRHEQCIKSRIGTDSPPTLIPLTTHSPNMSDTDFAGGWIDYDAVRPQTHNNAQASYVNITSDSNSWIAGGSRYEWEMEKELSFKYAHGMEFDSDEDFYLEQAYH